MYVVTNEKVAPPLALGRIGLAHGEKSWLDKIKEKAAEIFKVEVTPRTSGDSNGTPAPSRPPPPPVHPGVGHTGAPKPGSPGAAPGISTGTLLLGAGAVAAVVMLRKKKR